MNDSVNSSHRKRCRRYNDVGHAHFLTFSCYGRHPFLSKDRPRMWLIEAIDRARDLHHFDLWAYVIMPEHVHMIIWPTTEQYSVSRILNSLKQSVSRKAIIYLRKQAPESLAQLRDRQPNGTESYRFWQRGGGYDRNLVEPSTVWSTIEYLHANPVRRGLSKSPLEWEWSSAREFHQPGSGRLRIDRETLPHT